MVPPNGIESLRAAGLPCLLAKYNLPRTPPIQTKGGPA
jgi:hypothetical protein